MIIDCHGHCTTALDALGAYWERQKAEIERGPLHRHVKGGFHITGCESRESLDTNEPLKNRCDATHVRAPGGRTARHRGAS